MIHEVQPQSWQLILRYGNYYNKFAIVGKKCQKHSTLYLGVGWEVGGAVGKSYFWFRLGISLIFVSVYSRGPFRSTKQCKASWGWGGGPHLLQKGMSWAPYKKTFHFYPHSSFQHPCGSSTYTHEYRDKSTEILFIPIFNQPFSSAYKQNANLGVC